MLGRVEQYLLEKIKAEKSIHMTLIDPEKITAAEAAKRLLKTQKQWNSRDNDWRFNICFSRTPR